MKSAQIILLISIAIAILGTLAASFFVDSVVAFLIGGALALIAYFGLRQFFIKSGKKILK